MLVIYFSMLTSGFSGISEHRSFSFALDLCFTHVNLILCKSRNVIAPSNLIPHQTGYVYQKLWLITWPVILLRWKIANHRIQLIVHTAYGKRRYFPEKNSTQILSLLGMAFSLPCNQKRISWKGSFLPGPQCDAFLWIYK